MKNPPKWIWPLLALAAILLYNLIFTPGFFHIEIKEGHLYGSLVDILNRAAPVMLLAIGMTLVVATGGIDLSVGAVMAVCGSLAALMATKGRQSFPSVLSATLSAGAGLGLWNGLLVTTLKIQPIVATLVLMVSGRGIAQLMTGGQIVAFELPALVAMGSGHFLGLPVSVSIVAATAVVTFALTRLTALGLFIESTGDNPVATLYSGVNVSGVRLFVYGFSGLCAALAGLITIGTTRTADANSAGLYLELDAILAVVVGGTLLTGGRFTVAGSLLGALVIQAVTTTILTKGVPVEMTLVVKALAVIGVCLLQSDRLRERLSRKKVPA